MILVFGGNGQLGQELADAAAEEAVALVAASRARADIADAAAVRRVIAETRPSVVVNAAAYTKVDKAESEPEEARRGNETGPAVLAEACAVADVPLVHISTDYVFDGTKQGAYTEDDPVRPLGVYGRTKAAGEEAVRAHSRHLILRTSWVYGRFGANMLKTVLRLAAERDELRFVADQHGCPTSTRDIARAILAIAPRLAAGEALWGTYHFAGGGEATTWAGFVARIVEAQEPFTGRRPTVTPITTAEYPTPARRPANSALDSRRFAEAFGIEAAPWPEMTDWTVRRLLRP